MADTAAERLARTMEPDGDWHLDEWRIAVRLAQRAVGAGWVHRDDLIAQRWAPPPDPWEAISRFIAGRLWTADGEYFGDFCEGTVAGSLLAAVRDLIPDEAEARSIAARIESDR